MCSNSLIKRLSQSASKLPNTVAIIVPVIKIHPLITNIFRGYMLHLCDSYRLRSPFLRYPWYLVLRTKNDKDVQTLWMKQRYTVLHLWRFAVLWQEPPGRAVVHNCFAPRRYASYGFEDTVVSPTIVTLFPTNPVEIRAPHGLIAEVIWETVVGSLSYVVYN